MYSVKHILFATLCLLGSVASHAYTHADTLRGSNGNGRNWWNVQHYDLAVVFETAAKNISGSVVIELKVSEQPHDSMQIDLQKPMVLDSVIYAGNKLSIANEGDVWWVKYPYRTWVVGTTYAMQCYYHGKPRNAVHPPWDGGFIWNTDGAGNPWIAVACQGLGASVWWPCKDAQWDEPDNGQDMEFTCPANLQCISNGHLVEQKPLDHNQTYWHWQVKNPINNYDVTFYLGDYVHWTDTMAGEKGILPLDFYALRYNEAKARKQFAIVKPMLHCFEYWMGPYPFYEDGYKLVEAPYLGMEHQSAVAYGNEYQMGYLGIDRSGTGIGSLFDYIIVHESGHEWFGNNITATDIADNWIHEGITTFSESLFVNCMFGDSASADYSRGNRDKINNDRPLIGDYGVNNEGSGDMYRKGAAMMYMIRVLMNDDVQFRKMMRGLTYSFYHKTITTKQAENYIASYLPGINMTAFFNQYLRTKDIPKLEYYVDNHDLFFHFDKIVLGFSIPLRVSNEQRTTKMIAPAAEWQHIPWNRKASVSFNKDLLITIKEDAH